MKVIWTERSISEIEGIVDHILVDNPSAAFALADRIFEFVENLLPDNPNLGRPGRVNDTRELVVHASYLVAYRVKGSAIEILSVRHSARLWPKDF